MTSYYTINPFITYELEDELILQSKYGIDKISLENEKKLLITLQKKIGNTISDFEFQQYTEKIQVSGFFMQFLFDKTILSLPTPLQMGINNIYFYSSDNEFNNNIENLFENNHKIHVLNSIEEMIEKVEMNESDLFIAFFEEYDKRKAGTLRNSFKKNSNTYSSISYLYNGNLYIDSLYSSKWNLPCHLCHMNFIENEHRIGAEEQITYQIMIDELFNSNKEFKTKYNLSRLQKLNVLTQLCNFINSLSQPTTQVSKTYSIFTTGSVYDIKENILSKGSTHFWELCDCYE